jgi:hypothetical protein
MDCDGSAGADWKAFSPATAARPVVARGQSEPRIKAGVLHPERVSAIQRLTWAYLRTELYPGDSAWQAARDALTADPNPLGRVESK